MSLAVFGPTYEIYHFIATFENNLCAVYFFISCYTKIAIIAANIFFYFIRYAIHDAFACSLITSSIFTSLVNINHLQYILINSTYRFNVITYRQYLRHLRCNVHIFSRFIYSRKLMKRVWHANHWRFLLSYHRFRLIWFYINSTLSTRNSIRTYTSTSNSHQYKFLQHDYNLRSFTYTSVQTQHMY